MPTELEQRLEKDLDAERKLHSNLKDVHAETQKALSAKADEVNAEKKRADSVEAELKEFKKKEADRIKSATLDEVKEFCEAQVKEGKMTPSGRDEILSALKDEKTYSAEMGTVAIPFDTFKAFMEKQIKALDAGVRGGDKDDSGRKDHAHAQSEVDARVREYMAKNKVGYADALNNVLADNPELAKSYVSGASVGGDQ